MYSFFESALINTIYLSDFVKTWPLGFRLAPGAPARGQPGVQKSRGLDQGCQNAPATGAIAGYSEVFAGCKLLEKREK